MSAEFIRRATPADAGAIRDVTIAAYAKWLPILGRKPVPMLADYTEAVRSHLIDVFEHAGRIIALIELVPEPDCLLIENVAILPDHARRGHGSRLMVPAETIALYQRLGYTIDRAELKSDGRTIVHMSHVVPTAP